MKTFNLWVEGYAATGEFSGATYLGSYKGETFEDAVRAWDAERNTGERGPHVEIDERGCRVWGLRIYDNREDAERRIG